MNIWTDPVRFRRILVGMAAIAAGAFFLAGMLTDPQAADASHEAYLASLRDNPGMVQVSGNLLWVSFTSTAIMVLGMVHVVRGRGVALVHVGALLAVPGLMTMSGMLIIDYVELGIMQAVDLETAVAVGEHVEAMPGMVLFMLLAPLSFLGILLVAVALWRSGFLPVTFLLLVVAGHVVMFAGGGVTLVGQVGAAMLMAAYGWFGVRVLRLSDAAWATSVMTSPGSVDLTTPRSA